MNAHALTLRHLGIDTQREHAIYMHRDCHVCRAEGFIAQARVEVRANGRSILATLHVVESDLLTAGEAALSKGAERALGARAGDAVTVGHAPALDSLSAMRSKIFGRPLDADAARRIVGDAAADRYTDVQIAAFLAACAGGRTSAEETVRLTRAMVEAGARLDWGREPIADKHCIGGLPGNRTTPIVVAIVAAAGLTIPKTSSRAITSPAGTADVLETITRVDLDRSTMRRVVERTGGCLAWGGALDLSPADDVLVRVERALELDSDAQLVASVLSKKVAVGSTHVLIDMPVGPTAKIRSEFDADALARLFTHVGSAFGLRLALRRTPGTEPVGFGIGPALEAHDVLAVLRGGPRAPADLRARARSGRSAARSVPKPGSERRARGRGAHARRWYGVAAFSADLRSAGAAHRAGPSPHPKADRGRPERHRRAD